MCYFLVGRDLPQVMRTVVLSQSIFGLQCAAARSAFWREVKLTNAQREAVTRVIDLMCSVRSSGASAVIQLRSESWVVSAGSEDMNSDTWCSPESVQASACDIIRRTEEMGGDLRCWYLPVAAVPQLCLS